MIEIEDITDRDSLKQWLTDWPKENGLDEDAARAVAVTIAHRAAMRVLPVWWNAMFIKLERESASPDIQTLRFCLSSGVAAKHAFSDTKIDLFAKPATSVDTAFQYIFDASTSSISAAAFDTADAAVSAAAIAASFAADTISSTNAATTASTAVFHSVAVAMATSAADVFMSGLVTKVLQPVSPSPSSTDTDAASAAKLSANNMWNAIRSDCSVVLKDGDVSSTGLWPSSKISVAQSWLKVKPRATASEWSFWVKWYDDALAGNPPDWDMLEQIALIEPEVWEEGVEAVAKRIKEIESDFPIAAPVKKNALAVQQAVARNLAAIPPQVDALIATIDAEIERLRGKNPQDDVEQSEIDRLRQTFETMRGALVALSEKLPDKGEPSIADAEEMEGLLGIYGREFMKWPRENAADLVDSSCRVVLIGLTAGVLTAFGAPALAATAVAGVAFGGKKLVGLGKAMKDVAKPGD